MMATDVGLVVGKIPPKKNCIKTLQCHLGKMTIFFNLRVGVGISPLQIYDISQFEKPLREEVRPS